MPSLACVTMVYNEAIFLPIWQRYYSSLVGGSNCYVVDHGSTDGSTSQNLGVNIIKLPRSAHDNSKRTFFLEDFCSSLLRYHDFVLLTDIDEIVVANPIHYRSFADYLETAGDVTTCIGLNLEHWLHHEPALDIAKPILRQRTYAAPRRAMCKPLLIRKRIKWTPGFHSYDGPVQFGDLFLFHLAYVDLRLAMKRQKKRHTQLFATETSSPHHRVEDMTVRAWMEGWARVPGYDDVTFDDTCPRLSKFKGDLIEADRVRESSMYGFNMNADPNERWRVPEAFRDLF